MSESIEGELASETGEWGGEPVSDREWDDETGEDSGELRSEGEDGGEPGSEGEDGSELGSDGGEVGLEGENGDEPGVDLDPGSGSGKLLPEPGCDCEEDGEASREESCMRRLGDDTPEHAKLCKAAFLQCRQTVIRGRGAELSLRYHFSCRFSR